MVDCVMEGERLESWGRGKKKKQREIVDDQIKNPAVVSNVPSFYIKVIRSNRRTCKRKTRHPACRIILKIGFWTSDKP
jgi:hypothetical protein